MPIAKEKSVKPSTLRRVDIRVSGQVSPKRVGHFLDECIGLFSSVENGEAVCFQQCGFSGATTFVPKDPRCRQADKQIHYYAPMDTTVVVGLIAATASVSSVLANIYIAARTRQSALEALRFKADLDKRDGIAKSIKEIEVEGERLRIKCWQLVFWCNSGTNFRSDDVLFTNQINEFVKQSEVFLDRWANTKTELPLGTVEMLRAIRHNSRHLIEEVRIQAARCTESKHLPREELRRLVEVIQDLLRALDSFTKMVCEVRRGMLSGSITEETEAQFITLHGYPEDQSS